MKTNKSCTLYVSGMHCGSCEVLLNNKISKMNGVTNVDASLKDGSVDITYKKGMKPNITELNEKFSELGYSFSEDPIGVAKPNQLQVWQTVTVIIFLIIAYLIIEDTNLLARFTVNEGSSILAFFVLGIIASLSSCAALVGGVLLSMSKQWNQLYGGKDEQKRAIPFTLFNVGRIISFAVLGGVLGAIGSFFQISLEFTAILIIFVSIFMAVLGLQMLGVKWASRFRFGYPKFLSQYSSDEKNFKGRYMPFTMGVLTFFLPCGFTMMAQTIALTTGSFTTSMLMMLAFALGTLPMLAFISFSSIKFSSGSSLSGTFSLLAGLFLVVFGIYNMNSQFNVLGWFSLNDLMPANETTVQNAELGVEVVEENGSQVQLVNMEARGFEYFPGNLSLKAGVPTRLTVNNFNVLGCAQAMWLGGLYDEVVYLNTPQAEVEFTPQKGTYKISCTMGMVNPVIVEVI